MTLFMYENILNVKFKQFKFSNTNINVLQCRVTASQLLILLKNMFVSQILRVFNKFKDYLFDRLPLLKYLFSD